MASPKSICCALFILFLALSALTASAQTSVSSSVSPAVAPALTPPDDVRSLIGPVTGSAAGGAAINSAVSAQSSGAAGAGVFASDIGTSVRSTAGVGSSGRGAGTDWGASSDAWTGGKSEQQVRMGQISGFSTQLSGFRAKGAEATERRAFNTVAAGSPASAVISGQIAGVDTSLQNAGTSEETTTLRVPIHRTGAVIKGGFPDSTRMIIAASPGDPGSFALFGFHAALGSGLPELDNTNFLSPTPITRHSFRAQISSLSTTARLTEAWKEYELGIMPTNRMGGIGTRMRTGLTSVDPAEKLQQQERYRSEFGIYGANLIQRLQDLGLTGSGLEDQSLSH
jgi:hypothetical protein